MSKFMRNPKAQRRAGRSDKRATVQVSVYLRGDRGAYVKGNLFRSLSVPEARVSEVFKAIEAALYEDEAKGRNGAAA